MFYLIQKVDNHPCYNMQNILEIFFDQLLQKNAWNVNNQHADLKKVHWKSNFVSDLELLYNEILSKNDIVRPSICMQFTNNNKIEELCKNTLNLIYYINWEKGIGERIKKFFLDCYPDKLDLGIFKRPTCTTTPTKDFYQKFIALNGHVCPFCSLSTHKHPFGRKRGDFDHYILKANYPFASLNIDNLIPMCSECNQDYKSNVDILKNADGTRRNFIYPYSFEEAFRIEIDEMIFEEENWKFKINIISSLDPNLVESYDSVFDIKKRMQIELSKRYHSWLIREVRRYVSSNPSEINVIGFKSFLFNTAVHVIDLEDRVLDSSILEYTFYLYLVNTTDSEINDIFLKSYLFEYL